MNRFFILAVFLVTSLSVTQARAQTNENTLSLYQPVEGEVAEQAARWRFTARTNEPLSFLVEATSGDLDPILTIRTLDGQEIARNDDFNYPDSRAALLEALTFPSLGTYTATVSAHGETTGGYRLTMLRGYSTLIDAGLEDTWQSQSENVDLDTTDEGLRVVVGGDSPIGIVVNETSDPLGNMFAETQVSAVEGAGWIVGLAAQTDDNVSYSYQVNERGEWRVTQIDDAEESVLRDWSTHPAIRNGVTSFSLGMMTTSSGMDVFYNGETIGRVRNAGLSAQERPGLVVGALRPGNETAATFTDFVVTTPIEVEGERLVPQAVVIADPNFMVQGLARQGMVEANGELVLNVAESSTSFARPGVNVLPLASTLRFTNLAIGTTFYPSVLSEGPGGCGLVLRMTDDEHYVLGYFEQTGGFGLSRRDGDTFATGLYGEADAWEQGEPHHLLVIADASTLHLYVDGQYAGSQADDVTEGGVGNAVVNFEALNTTCRFTNTWVWRWE